MGHWTKECEEWYQERLTLLQEERALPKSGREWSKSLRSSHQSGKFHAVYSEAAKKYLAGDLS